MTQELIGVLFKRRFPQADAIRNAVITINSPLRADYQASLAAMLTYRDELSDLPYAELVARYLDQQDREMKEARDDAEREELSQRFFAQVNVRADYEHWSMAAHWTIDEAVALSFGM